MLYSRRICSNTEGERLHKAIRILSLMLKQLQANLSAHARHLPSIACNVYTVVTYLAFSPLPLASYCFSLA